MQLFFLLCNDITQYKLATNVYDLTTAQIEFYKCCAERIQNAINDVKNGTTDNAATNPYRIDAKNDSPDVINEKLDLYKSMMGM